MKDLKPQYLIANPDIHLMLVRFSQTEDSTLGYLYVMKGKQMLGSFTTLELPDRGNQKNISCIPLSKDLPNGVEYSVSVRQPTTRFNYPHLIVNDVPDRTAILFHKGNYSSNTEGCVLIGTYFADVNGDGFMDVSSSALAFSKLMSIFTNPSTLVKYPLTIVSI